MMGNQEIATSTVFLAVDSVVPSTENPQVVILLPFFCTLVPLQRIEYKLVGVVATLLRR